MASNEMSDEDLGVIESILRAYQADGVENPKLPAYAEPDENDEASAIVDAFALDESGKLTIVHGVKLGDTVYVSRGED